MDPNDHREARDHAHPAQRRLARAEDPHPCVEKERVEGRIRVVAQPLDDPRERAAGDPVFVGFVEPEAERVDSMEADRGGGEQDRAERGPRITAARRGSAVGRVILWDVRRGGCRLDRGVQILWFGAQSRKPSATPRRAAPPTPMKLTILGGGVAGLSAALAAHRRGAEVELHEASARLGGNATTFRCGEFAFDSGAHRFHDRHPEVTREMWDLLGSASRASTRRAASTSPGDSWISRSRRSICWYRCRSQ